jgi:hypothetical protein
VLRTFRQRGVQMVRALLRRVNAENCHTFQGWTFNPVLPHRYNSRLSTYLNPSVLETPVAHFSQSRCKSMLTKGYAGQRMMLADAETSNPNTSGGEVTVIDASSEIASLRRLKPRRTVLPYGFTQPKPASLLPHPATRYFRHRPAHSKPVTKSVPNLKHLEPSICLRHPIQLA